MVFGCGRADRHAAWSGRLTIDGSSSVYPLLQAAAEDLHRSHRGLRVTVGMSGTRGGFERFTAGDTDVTAASRPISAGELHAARTHGVRFCEIPIARGGITVAVSRSNHYVDHLTLDELRRVFGDARPARTWAEVRPGWPARPLQVFAPGPDSGSFGDFRRRAFGSDEALRSDLRATEDDNQLVVGVAASPDAVGFFGRAWFARHREQVRAVPLDAGSGPVAPDAAAIAAGAYEPFGRPLFVYVSLSGADRRPQRDAFVRYLLGHARELATELGYVPLEADLLARALQKYLAGDHGTHFTAPGDVRRPLREVYR